MSQSFLQSFFFPKLLLGPGFLFATAQAQINFFPATREACNELNFPCQGGIYCCPRPTLCIPYSNQLVCLNIGGDPVDGGTGGVPLDGLIDDILGGAEVSIPPVISGGEIDSLVLPTIPVDGGEMAFTPSISGGGLGPIVIPTIISDNSEITFTPSFPNSEVGPIVIPTLPPVPSGGDDGSVAGGQTITRLPPPSTTTIRPSTSAPPVSSSTIPTSGRASNDNNKLVTTPPT